jgi:twinkle protein
MNRRSRPFWANFWCCAPCRFTTIYLWLDDDVAGQDGAASFARKLGVQRCLIVRTRGGGGEGPKDANDALKVGFRV